MDERQKHLEQVAAAAQRYQVATREQMRLFDLRAIEDASLHEEEGNAWKELEEALRKLRELRELR